MGVPDTYRQQQLCATCRHVFKRIEHDEGHEYFCTYDGAKRPLCGSVLMDEYWWGSAQDKADRRGRWAEWDRWAEPRRVSSCSICDEYEERT